MLCEIRCGPERINNSAYEMHRPIACYFPERKGEDFAGNEHIVKTMSGIKISDNSDLDAFCDRALK